MVIFAGDLNGHSPLQVSRTRTHVQRKFKNACVYTCKNFFIVSRYTKSEIINPGLSLKDLILKY